MWWYVKIPKIFLCNTRYMQIKNIQTTFLKNLCHCFTTLHYTLNVLMIFPSFGPSHYFFNDIADERWKSPIWAGCILLTEPEITILWTYSYWFPELGPTSGKDQQQSTKWPPWFHLIFQGANLPVGAWKNGGYEADAHKLIFSLLNKGSETQALVCCIHKKSGSLRGYLHLGHFNEQTLEIAYLKVQREFQRRGLASLLLEGGLRLARERRKWTFHEISLNVATRNVNAVRFYESKGFKHCGRPKQCGRPKRAAMSAFSEWSTMKKQVWFYCDNVWIIRLCLKFISCQSAPCSTWISQLTAKCGRSVATSQFIECSIPISSSTNMELRNWVVYSVFIPLGQLDLFLFLQRHPRPSKEMQDEVEQRDFCVSAFNANKVWVCRKSTLLSFHVSSFNMLQLCMSVCPSMITCWCLSWIPFSL